MKKKIKLFLPLVLLCSLFMGLSCFASPNVCDNLVDMADEGYVYSFYTCNGGEFDLDYEYTYIIIYDYDSSYTELYLDVNGVSYQPNYYLDGEDYSSFRLFFFNTSTLMGETATYYTDCDASLNLCINISSSDYYDALDAFEDARSDDSDSETSIDIDELTEAISESLNPTYNIYLEERTDYLVEHEDDVYLSPDYYEFLDNYIEIYEDYSIVDDVNCWYSADYHTLVLTALIHLITDNYINAQFLIILSVIELCQLFIPIFSKLPKIIKGFHGRKKNDGGIEV